jgi:hypothetical protein
MDVKREGEGVCGEIVGVSGAGHRGDARAHGQPRARIARRYLSPCCNRTSTARGMRSPFR